MNKVAIIGGGASAMFCACFIKNSQVTIFEKNEKLGKKILATGNGRCNLTNLNMNKCSYNQNVSEYLNRFNQNDTLKFFSSLGLVTYADDEGRVYPFSNTANSVLDVFNNYLSQKNNIQYKLGVSVEYIEKTNDGYFVCYDNGNREYFDKVIIACGNLIKEEILKGINIKFNKQLPSLCALKTQKHKNLAGVRVSDVKVSCKLKDNYFEEMGEVLFREDGISGIVVFNLSSFMARLGSYKANVKIDLLPKVNQTDLVKMLQSRKDLLKNYKIDDFLTGFFHKAINFEILKRSKLNLEKQVDMLSVKDIENIASVIKNFEMQTLDAHNNNQVMCGGVCLEELDNNLQSIKHKGLYIIGEAVDVDGTCGGYNLQWAWTSGKIVGENL